MTRQTVEKLPMQIRNTLEMMRKDYKNDALNRGEVRNRISGYMTGLRDAGAITERERQILVVYCYS